MTDCSIQQANATGWPLRNEVYGQYYPTHEAGTLQQDLVPRTPSGELLVWLIRHGCGAEEHLHVCAGESAAATDGLGSLALTTLSHCLKYKLSRWLGSSRMGEADDGARCI